jgi:hypothetical protein
MRIVTFSCSSIMQWPALSCLGAVGLTSHRRVFAIEVASIKIARLRYVTQVFRRVAPVL